MKVGLSIGRAAFDALQGEWTRLGPSTPFQAHAWSRHWLEHLAADAEPWILRAGEPPAALLPLVRVKEGGLRILRLLGHGPSDYLGIIGSDADVGVASALGALLSRQLEPIDLVDLRGWWSNDPCRGAFLRGLDRPHLERIYERCPIIDTTGSWEEYLAERTRRFRANLKRTRRRVEDQGAVRTGIETPSPALFDECLDVERESWKWREGLSFLRAPGSREFFRRVLLDPKMPSELWACRSEGALIAYALVLRAARTRYYYLPSFRQGYPDVGSFLLSEIVRDSFASEVDEFDFLQGDERYKLVWATGDRCVHQMAAAGRGVLGRPALAWMGLRWRLAGSERLQALRRRALSRWSRFRHSDADGSPDAAR